MSDGLGGFGRSEIDFSAWRQTEPPETADIHDLTAPIRIRVAAPKPAPIPVPAAAPSPTRGASAAAPRDGAIGGYYIRVAGEERGPFTFAQLRGMWSSGKLTLSTQYRGPGAPTWEALANLASDLEQVERPPKSRALYIVLGLFLGLLGVHNFYVGRYRRGFFQILLPWAGLAILLASLPSLRHAQEKHFEAAVAAINEGRPHEKFITAPSLPAMAALMGAAAIAILPFWVIGEVIFISRDGLGRKMV